MVGGYQWSRGPELEVGSGAEAGSLPSAARDFEMETVQEVG